MAANNRRASFKRRPLSATPSRSDDAGADEGDDPSWTKPETDVLKECHICLEPILLLKDLCIHAGLTSHAACQKNKRYLDDQARQRGAIRSMRCYQARHPVDYAYRVKDISDNRNIFGHRRGAMVRAVCETFLTECIEFEKTSTVRPLLFLSQRGHKAWLMRELLYTEEEAESKWDRSADKTVRRKHEEEVLKLAVVGHTQEIPEVGKITQSSTGLEAFQATSSKRALHAVVDKDNRRPRNPRMGAPRMSPLLRRATRGQRARGRVDPTLLPLFTGEGQATPDQERFMQVAWQTSCRELLCEHNAISA